jgi:hypothetical protein
MAVSLPNFLPFQLYKDEQSSGQRWKKWIDKFDNLICALDITDDKRKKAFLLHYVGDDVYNVYNSFSDERKGIGAVLRVGEEDHPNEYEALKKSLADYFTPKQNTTYERF